MFYQQAFGVSKLGHNFHFALANHKYVTHLCDQRTRPKLFFKGYRRTIALITCHK